MHVKCEAMQALVRCFLPVGLVTLLFVGAGCASDDDDENPRCVVPLGTSPTRGPADAWVTIVEFGDFQCSYCGKAQAIVREVDAERPGLRWAFKHMPLTQLHARAAAAALAAECAKEQGQFWEMHDVLFANQGALGDASLVSYAKGLGLELTAWNTCRDSDAAKQRIIDDYNLALDIGVRGTPAFFINGASLPGAYPTESFLELVDGAEQAAQQSGVAKEDYYASIEGRCPGL